MLTASIGLHCAGSEVVAVGDSCRATDAKLRIAGPSVALDEAGFLRVFLSFRTQWEPFSLFLEYLDCYY